MFLASKGFKKEDLIVVAQEIGEVLPQKATISDLKDLILKSKEYLADPDFVASILVTTVNDRRQKEEYEEKLRQQEYEEKLRQQEYEEQSRKLEYEEQSRKLEYEEHLRKLEYEEQLRKLEYEEKERARKHELEMARLQVSSLVTGESSQNITIASARKQFNLPKLELRQFSGDIKDWLPFWGQFEQIHNDEEIPPENKFQYLIQATTIGSRAREVVESFPPTGANYSKAVDSLKARFGREDLLVEVYVRELLKLIISVQKHEKITMTSLYDKLESYLRALETLGVTTEKCASILFPMVESCFQEEFLKAWNRSTSCVQSVDAKERLTNIMAFLKAETEGEERINLAMSGFGLGTDEKRQFYKKRREVFTRKIPTAANLLTTDVKDVKKICVFCSGKHKSVDCFSARNMSLAERENILRDKKCCFACLTQGHRVRNCKAFLRCIACGKRHVPLMCETLAAKNHEPDKTDQKGESSEVNMSNVTYSQKVFLQTLKIKLISDKKEIVVRAILDSGSQRTYILKNLAEEMGYYPLRKETLMHSLFGGQKSDKFEHTCYRIRLRNPKNNWTCNMEALDHTCICDNISPVSTGLWIKELQEMKIKLSDVGDATTQPVQILLGADVMGKLMTGQRRVLTCGLVAMETELGWTLSGKVPGNSTPLSNAMMVTSLLIKEMEISDMWKLDSIGIRDPSEQKTKEELHEASVEHFLRTVKIDEDQRFLVSLPWLDTHLPLPDNFNLALKGLQATTYKLKKEKLYEEYGKVFEEWEREGVIEEVPEQEMILPCHYLPHRHVVKENSTTKIRPVFNASSKQKGFPSLNDCVEKGLNLIEVIPFMINKFRAYKFGVTADIRKAFLQISLYEKDRNFLRFLWYTENGQLKHFRHRRVVFGVSCSPFLLGATIQYHLKEKLEEAMEGCKKYPEYIIKELMCSFYVDNCLTSVKTKPELEQFIEVATEIMAERKFDLRGWECTNPSEVFVSETNILGMKWNRHSDTLSINVPDMKEVSTELITKRNILAASHKVFDPIGIISPVLLSPKLWLQDLWKTKIGWDDEVDIKTRKDFLKWLTQLDYLKQIEVPRWLHCEKGYEHIKLHFFCDASKFAYSAVVFLRTENENAVNVQLVQCKARIAPCGRKETTIARLELLGATITARLSIEILKQFPTDKLYFWTDSTTVLAWIKREDAWGVFVQNRVQEIRKLTPVKAWRHLPGSLNPADLPSRGCSAQQLCNSKWWEGPDWLYLSPLEWPVLTDEISVNEEEVNSEKRKQVVTSLVNVEVTEIMSNYFSTYSRNVRVLAWILRFIHNVSHQDKLKGSLTCEEFEKAELLIFKCMQTTHFQDTKILAKLQAFRDKNGLLRVKTKLVHSDENENFRCPILLPANSTVLELIREEHIKAKHAGRSILLSRLRERYWILKAKKLVKEVISTCVICKRQQSRPVEVPFAPLPKERVTQTKVFQVSGVDYAGPLYLKSKEKAWIVLFTCAVYRAVHFELVQSLTTETFIQALRRFIARRGRISVLYSDNGKNFVGANNALKDINWDKIVMYSTAQKINWKFIPPTAAWWGGWWERMVGMLKNLLRRVLGKSVVDYVELTTILCDCESVINTRPLTYIHDDTAELVPLTPAMFILGEGSSETPDLDHVDRNSMIKRMKYLQKLRDDLKQRFRNEYLAQLVHKGIRKKFEISVGDIVLIGHDNARRIDWPLGIVLELYQGKDNIPRVAKLRTAQGERIRPFQRLYPLEVSAKNDIDVLKKTSKKNDLAVAKISKSVKAHDNTEVLPNKNRSGRTIKIPQRLDL